MCSLCSPRLDLFDQNTVKQFKIKEGYKRSFLNLNDNLQLKENHFFEIVG